MPIKKTLVALITTLFTLPTLAHELNVTVSNIKTTKGDLLVAVYGQEENYNTNTHWVAAKKVKISETSVTLAFPDLPAGNYAVKLFQDENENGQIDKNLIGIPTEPYGFSNNGGSYGPASFEEAKVAVQETTNIEIQLR